MLLAKTTFWVALVAVSYKDPSPFIPAAFKDVRVIQHITLDGPYVELAACRLAIMDKLREVSQETMDTYKVRIHKNECEENVVEYYVPVPLPKRRPTI